MTDERYHDANFGRRVVVPFVPRVTPYRQSSPEVRFRKQFARFLSSQSARVDAAIELVARIADRSFAPKNRVAEAHSALSEIRWRPMSEDQIATFLARWSDGTIDVMLRAMFEALPAGASCDHWLEMSSVYRFNSEFRRLMSRLPSFRSWLARDFFVAEDPAHRRVSRFASDIATMLDGELRRLRKAGYLTTDDKIPHPFQIHVHKTMPHLGFLVVEFSDRQEVLELNQATGTVVGDFAFANGTLVRARCLPLAWDPPRPFHALPSSARACTKVALVRLARHLFLATDDTAQPIDEVFERVFVSTFMKAAVPGTDLGRVPLSAHEIRRWSKAMENPAALMDFEPPPLSPWAGAVEAAWAKDWNDLVRDPTAGARVVQPFGDGGIEPTTQGFRDVFYSLICHTRRLLLGWYSDRLLAKRVAVSPEELDEPPGDQKAGPFLMGRFEPPDGIESFFQWDEVPGVATMHSHVFFIREPDCGTVRIVVTGSIASLDDREPCVDLFPVEVRLPVKVVR